MHLRYLWYILVPFVALIIGQPAEAQIVINEICTYNGDVLEDEDGDEPDWIELYNAGPAAVDLYQYALSGEGSDPWLFPQVTLQSQTWLIVFASGKNRTAPNLHTDFKLSKDGETVRLLDPALNLLDEITVPALHLDHSYGLSADGAGTPGIFEPPTPGTSNALSVAHSGYATDPVFSLAAGFYNGSCTLDISGGGPSQIFYTTDGSPPTASSSVYTGPITIDSTTVIRARSISALSIELPSRIITSTYILNYPQTLPVFSISTDPANLWDWNTGIYVTGPNASPVYPYYGANFWQDWEIPANIEFFETGGVPVFSQTAGVSIHGGSSNRTKPMKSLRLTNRSKYGRNGFDHRFFEQKNIDDFKVIVLRNSSGDFNRTHFRDGSLHKLMLGNADIDLSAYRPSAVFLNGVYHGVHNIRERISRHYLGENYGIDEQNVDLLEEDSLVIEGDFADFNAMHAFVTGNSMANPSHFEAAAKWIDLHSLCDYYIAETFLSNTDWPYNNIKFWRVRETGAKWRYILIDLDIALGNLGWAPADFDILGRIMGPYGDNNRHVQIFRSLVANPQFREYFINRYADLVNTLFHPAAFSKHILQVRETLEIEMPLHFAKWGNNMQGWDQEIFQLVIPHIEDRPAFALEQVRNVFSLNKVVPVELDVWPPGAGVIRINTITPGPLPWNGAYFDGNEITVCVIPNSGYHFVRWDSDHITLKDPASPVFRVNPRTENKFVAYFGNGDDSRALMVFPNPAREFAHVGYFMEYPTTGRIEITDAPGKQVLVQTGLPLSGGVNTLDVAVHSLASGVYSIRLIAGGTEKSARLVKY
jgi:hypothetical protein